MPDVDAEWAKFEHDVIDAEVKSHKRVMLWGLSIAASIALVIGFFLFAQDADEQAETMVAIAEKPVVPNTHAADVITPAKEETPATEEMPKTKKATKVKQHSDIGQLAMTIPLDTKKEEATSNHPATEESVKVFSSVEQSPGYPGGQRPFRSFSRPTSATTAWLRNMGQRVGLLRLSWSTVWVTSPTSKW